MYYSNKDIRVEEMPKPVITEDEILVQVLACGICGSDVMEWYRRDKAPLVLGHEIAGVIAEIGNNVSNYRVGDRISASHHVPCNTCHFCLSGHQTACETLRRTNFHPGGFSEFLRLPAINVDRGIYRIPEEVSFAEATFTEPLACVLRAQKKANLQPGQTVLVIGSGISGILHINLAKAMGAGRIIATDINDFRLAQARKFGAEFVLNAKDDIPAKVRGLNLGLGADLIIVTTGAVSALQQALATVERGGTILFFAPTDAGITIPISINNLFFRNDITLTTSYAGDRADHLTAMELIRAKRVQVAEMITHQLPLAQIGAGFKLVAEAKESIKVIIEPQK